jgi:hypothetical protein
MPVLRVTARVLFAALATASGPDSIAQGIPGNFMNAEDEIDSAPTAAELKIINKLTPDQIKRIDEVLLANTALEWSKVARVVGSAMLQMKGEYPGLPDVYYSNRITELVAAGKLQSRGDLRRMRYSEVRISRV